MQATKTLHALSARSQHQVIGVAEDDVRPGIFHLVHVERLYRTGGADRHEGRRANVAARCFQNASPGLALSGGDFERKNCHIGAIGALVRPA